MLKKQRLNTKASHFRGMKPKVKRLGRQALLSFLSLLIGVQPLLAQSAAIQAAQNADPAHQPNIGAAANGVPLVDIVAPNGSGLSHNKYDDFNVGSSGLILNNSNQNILRSNLGGLLQGNPNLSSSGPAQTILNEVTSANRSALQGTLEVHGTAANVIIANPNGMTCDGCGFINTPHVTLSTGVPQIDATGALSSLLVEQGDITIGTNGADLSTVDAFDLISRTISVGGPVTANGDLNLIAGRNSYAYQTGLITPLTSDGNEPGVAIDSSLLGGMYAGRIKIISNDAGAGVNMQGQMTANANGMTLTADGKLVLGKVRAKKAVAATSTNNVVQVSGDLFSEESITLQGQSAIDVDANIFVAAQTDLSLQAETTTLGSRALIASGSDEDGNQSNSGNLTVTGTTLNAGDAQIAAGDTLTINAAQININRASDTGTDTLKSLGDIALNASNINATNGRVSAGNDVAIQSSATLNVTAGTFEAGGEVNLEGTTITTSADVTAGTNIALNATNGNVDNSGNVIANAGALRVDATGDLANSGKLSTKTDGTISIDGDLSNSGSIVAEKALVIAGKSGARLAHLNNSASTAVVNGGESLNIKAASLNNEGGIGSSGGAVDVELSGNLANQGLFYSGTSTSLKLDGTLTNINADILAETDLAVSGLSSANVSSILNQSANIESIGGDVTLSADTITNERQNLSFDTTSNTQQTETGNPSVTVVTTQEIIGQNTVASKILAGGSITLNSNAVSNSYSLVAANADITINAASVNNIGRDLIETVATTTTTTRYERYCAFRIFICFDWDTRTIVTNSTDTTSSTYDSVFGTIEAGGNLNATVSGFLTNNAVRGGADQIGLASGTRALNDAESLSGTNTGLDTSVDAVLGRSALFGTTQSPNSPYLIEMRSEFIDPSEYFGSDFFLNQIGGYDPDQTIRRFGDAYVETRLILDQVFEQTGQRRLGNAADTRAFIQSLYEGGIQAQQQLGLEFGVALTQSQIASLTQDITWLETRLVQGENVLVPRLYIASTTRENVQLASAQIRAGGQTNIDAETVINTGDIAGEDGLRIAATQSVINQGGGLRSDADIVIDGGKLFANNSGVVEGENITITAADVLNDTAKTRDQYANGFADRNQQVGRIAANNNLTIDADNKITSIGGQFEAGGDLKLDAGGAVEISALEIERLAEDRFAEGYNREASLTNQLARLNAEGNIVINSGGDVALRGVDSQSGGDTNITAEGDVTIAGVQDSKSSDYKFDIDTGWFFGVETNVREQSGTIETRRSTIQSGGEINITSNTQDVEIDAARLESEGQTQLSALQGDVELRANTDSNFERNYRREEDLLWWNEEDRGLSVEDIEEVEIVAGGGLKITAADNIVVEYQAHENLDTAIDQLAATPGLEWMAELGNDPQVDWQSVKATVENWDYESQGLTQAGALLITAITSFATQGLTAGWAESLTQSLGLAGNAAAEAAIQAGLRTLVNQSAVALVNNQGDLGAALQELGSSGNLRSLITAMVSAGLSTQLIEVAGLNAVDPTQLTAIETVQYKLQTGLINATVNATVSAAIEGGDLGDNLFSGWTNAMVMAGLAGVQQSIGDFAQEHNLPEGSLPKILAHAVAGGLASELTGGDFASGALGGGLAELTSSLIGESSLSPDQQIELQRLIATAAVLIATDGDTQQAGFSGSVAASAHRHNYLTHAQFLEMEGLLEKCGDEGECTQDVLKQYLNISLEQEHQLLMCGTQLDCLARHLPHLAQTFDNPEINEFLTSGLPIALRASPQSQLEARTILAIQNTSAEIYGIKAWQQSSVLWGLIRFGPNPDEVRAEYLNYANWATTNCASRSGASCLVEFRRELHGYGGKLHRQESREIATAYYSIGVGGPATAISIKALPALGRCIANAACLAELGVGAADGLLGFTGATSGQTFFTATSAGTVVVSKGADKIVGFIDDAGNIFRTVSSKTSDGRALVQAADGALHTMDDAGKIGQRFTINTTQATKGTPEYALLNNPPANTIVELDNGTVFRTNSGGFVEEISFNPILSSGTRDARQTAVGKEGISGDVGGHIQACRLGGTCDRFNLFPQNSNFNNSAYKTWENDIAKKLENGDDVGAITVRFERSSDLNARPDALEIEYTVNGNIEVRQFENIAGGG